MQHTPGGGVTGEDGTAAVVPSSPAGSERDAPSCESAYPVPVSVIHSTEDASIFQRFCDHLVPLVRNGLICLWIDFPLRPRMRARRRVLAACEKAQIAISLITPDCLKYDLPSAYLRGLLAPEA